MPLSKYAKISTIAGLTALTLSIHYGWAFEAIFGHMHWFHALHGRFCYIPIVVAASWFGLRGGLVVAATISAFVLPYIVRASLETHELAGELVEIVFYFLMAGLVGALVEREILARRQQQEAEIKAERSQKLSLVGQIAAGVAHEIKNPLTSIKGAADILGDDKTSIADRLEFRGILHNEVRRIDATVSEFLEFARPRETRLEITSLSDTIRACVRQVTTQARQSDVRIVDRLEIGVLVKGDSEKLHQMTLNLVLNAIQASRSGDTVSIHLATTNQSTAVLDVTDSGTGIKEIDLGRVFEPFFTTKASGTGLGLAIVKSIVDSHGGTIRVKSAVNEGTTATVELPAWKEEE